MAHRIYLYNYDEKTNQSFETHLGEWNYEIPLLLYPLIAENIRVEDVEFFSDKEQGIVQLRYFFNLLADTYKLHYKKAYYEPVNQMFEFLEALPYDSFIMNATDVFHMNEEAHKVQAKQWLTEIQQKSKLYKKAVKKQDISVLDSLFSRYGYSSFLDILQTDWVNYGLGYFEEHAYKKAASSVFEENGKFGLKSSKGVILVPAIYDEIFEADDIYGISVVQKNTLFGYLQSDGKELIAPIYEQAFQVFDFQEDEPLGEVTLSGKSGILKINSNTWLLPADYDSIESVAYGFLSIQKDGKFGVYSNEKGIIIPLESESAYEYDYHPELFFTKERGTAKRRYHTREGHYLGNFVEGSIVNAGESFWIKPNKFNKKGQLIDNIGNIVADEVDRLISVSHFEVVAFSKEKQWQLYHTVKNLFLLNDLIITNVTINQSAYYKKNVFVLDVEQGKGIYDADQERWLVNPQSNIHKVHYLENGFLSVQKDEGHQLFDFEMGLSPELYDYISNPMNYRSEEGLLFLYKNQNLYKIHEDKSIHPVEETEYSNIYLNRYSFRGKDLEYFISFYNRWKDLAGENSEQFLDVETIRKIAFDAKESGNFTESLRLFEIAAQKNDADSWVEIGLLLTDPEIKELFNPQKGILYYEKAAQQNHPVAWNNIGALYQNGIGFSQNIKKAIQAYEKAGQLGDGMAFNNLGDLYYFGEHVKQDYKNALKFYQQAEQKRYYNYDKISEIHYQQRDYENLLVYLKKDYDQSYSGIYYGIIYELGLGVKADLKKAITYFEQANRYNPYEYATQRLVYYYKENPEFKNENKYQKWKSFAEENGFETE